MNPRPLPHLQPFATAPLYTHASLPLHGAACRRCCTCWRAHLAQSPSNTICTAAAKLHPSPAPFQSSIPSVLQLLAPQLGRARGGLALRQLVSSGELLPADLARQLLRALPDGCSFLNLYGGRLTWRHGAIESAGPGYASRQTELGWA